MSELRPQLSQETIDLAIDAAQASNRTWDRLQHEENQLNKVREVADIGVDGIAVSTDAIKALELRRDGVKKSFDTLVDMAGVVITPEYNPFAKESDADVEVDKPTVESIPIETFHALEKLPVEFRNEVVKHYTHARKNVKAYIEQGILGREYEMPELGSFMEQITAVLASYEQMKSKGWKPEVIFRPNGLTASQWDKLLTGNLLPNNSNRSNGLYRTWEDSQIVDPEAKPTNLWGVTVISALDKPAITSVSKNGKNAKNVFKELAGLPTVNGKDTVTNIERSIKAVSPSEADYLTLQLAIQERGEQPVDSETWTIGKEDLKVDGSSWSTFFYFNPDVRQVRSVWNDRDNFVDVLGLRPSVRAEDVLALKA